MITSERKDYCTCPILGERNIAPHFYLDLVYWNLKCTIIGAPKQTEVQKSHQHWLYVVVINTRNLCQVL